MRVKALLVILLATLLMVLIGAEVYLRYFTRLARPAFYENNTPKTVCRPDPQLGWVNKPGIYTAPAPSSGGFPLTVTIRDDGSRATAAQDAGTDGRRHTIALVGCSFMFGEGLSDEQTMAWKLQQLFPEKRVLNYGVMAYGTYQSLLMLGKRLPGLRDTDIVIYGFMVHHIDRNVAPAYWRATLNLYSKQPVLVPYVTLNRENRLARNAPKPFTPWFAGRHLIAFRNLEAYLKAKAFMAGNNTEKHTIMQLLLLEMRDRCKSRGCPLIVAMLNAPQNVESFYTGFCRANQIPVINFDLGPIRDKPLQNPEDGHPNETVNTLWAEQTARFLSGMPRSSSDSGSNPSANEGIPVARQAQAGAM